MLLILAAAIALDLPGVTADAAGLIRRFHDDAFYYFQIARNVAAGNGFTFDGIHATNGFHPLWLFVLVPVFRWVPGDVAPLRVVALVEIALVAAAALIVLRVLRGRIAPAAALAAALAIVALPGSREALRCGMEGGLLLFLMAAVWDRYLAAAASAPGSPRRWLALGLWCALAFLTRLEAILVLPAIVFLRRRRLRSDTAALAALLTPCAVALAAYLAWNRAAFDLWLPVSGLVKAHAAVQGSLGSRLAAPFTIPWIGHEMICRAFGKPLLRLCPPWAIALYALLVAALAAAAWRHRGSLVTVVRQSGIAFPLLASALIVLADVVLLNFLYPWYRVPIVLATALLGGTLLGGRPGWARGALAMLVAACVARAFLLAVPGRSAGTSYGVYRVQAARWLAQNTGEPDRIGSWNAGMLGYFSHRHVVNLDGLVNDAAYLTRVIQGRDLRGYLTGERIGWLADQACGPDPRPTYYLGRTGSERLDGELDLSAAFFDRRSADGCPGYAVWRRRGPAGGWGQSDPPALARPRGPAEIGRPP